MDILLLHPDKVFKNLRSSKKVKNQIGKYDFEKQNPQTIGTKSKKRFLTLGWSERGDSNSRYPAPKGALKIVLCVLCVIMPDF